MRWAGLGCYVVAAIAEAVGLILLGSTAHRITVLRAALTVLEEPPPGQGVVPDYAEINAFQSGVLAALAPSRRNFAILGLGVVLGLAGNVLSLFS